MCHKGIVLEIKKDYCLVLADDGTVFRIKTKEGIAEGQKIYFLDEDIFIKENKDCNTVILPFRNKESKAKIRKSTAQKIIAVAAALLICFSTIGVFNYNNQAYAAVSMDGKDSLQFEINRKGKIVKIISYGDLLDSDDIDIYEGMTIEELWKCFLKKDQSDLHLIGYIALNGKNNTEKDIINKIKNITRGSDIIYLKGDKEDIEFAEEENISIGKYISTQFPDEDELEDFLEHTTKESLLKYIEDNKDKITKEESDMLIKAKDQYDTENSDVDDDDDDDNDDEEDEEDDDD